LSLLEDFRGPNFPDLDPKEKAESLEFQQKNKKLLYTTKCESCEIA